MDLIFLCVIIFLFLLAVFNLSVGVSNDAVNFLNSALGTKAASFKRIIIVASIGVLVGASMSNGMMDIARHGIFRPENFSFYDLICIFMAVMVTNIIMLDIFNSLGLPTSTTVAMVFELLGATFIVALLKMADGTDLGFNDLLNTESALQVTIGIFLSVAVAFVFGTIVQFIARTVFSFNYRSSLKWKIGIFGGLCTTAIIYFMLIKGLKDLTFMTPEAKAWVNHNTWWMLPSFFAFFTVLMQLLHMVGVNVLKVIVMLGTFALAMAFAGNDLVNFIGVPLSGLEAFNDYTANGGGDASGYMMNSLNGPSHTPLYFLIGAGVIMVVSLATSKKAHNVSKTEIGLGSSAGGDEMFGSSRISRRLVRLTLNALNWMEGVIPHRVRAWFGRRFNTDEAIMEQGASFDLVRGAVNLVLAAALIAIGTSLKLPLSTTFVTFMVAMGSSLSDRAWGRESAVFRITGVMTVIGGWFLTAGVAFIGAGLIVVAMHFGGQWVMILLAAVTIFIIVRSNLKFKEKKADENGDTLFQAIITGEDKEQAWDMLLLYITEQQQQFVSYSSEMYPAITEAFITENARALSKAESSLLKQKAVLKNARRKETLCLRQVTRATAIEKSTWFHLSNSCLMNILYNMRRITEVCHEHVDNNFLPLPVEQREKFAEIQERITTMFNDTLAMMSTGGGIEAIPMLRRNCDQLKDIISDAYHKLHADLREGDPSTMTVLYVYINVLHESREMVSAMRKYLRAYAKLRDSEFTSRE